MKKRRVNWAFGNPACTAWEVETVAGLLVVRRNHALVRAGARWRQGWDVWLGGKFAGALSSRTLSDLATLSRGELLAVLRPPAAAGTANFKTINHVSHQRGRQAGRVQMPDAGLAARPNACRSARWSSRIRWS